MTDPAVAARERAWRALLLIAIVIMLPAALYRVPVEFGQLVSGSFGAGAATDLRDRFVEARAWFTGRPVYGVIESADYPPASYLLLAPLVRWPTLGAVRWIWAAATAGALAWLVLLALRESTARTRTEKLAAALLPLALYATAVTIRFGQSAALLLPLLIAGTLLVARRPPSWRRDLLAAVLLLPALVKPTFAAPLLLVPFVLGGWRVAGLVSGGYAVLTLAAAEFQQPTLQSLLAMWLRQRGNIALDQTHANLHAWLAGAGLTAWLVPASLMVLAAAAWWTWRYRGRDVWLLLGVAAIVARIWAYHRAYDDVLLIVPLIALFRIGIASGPRAGVAMGIWLIVIVMGVQLETFWLGHGRLGSIAWGIRTAGWLVLLGFLLWQTATAQAVAAQNLASKLDDTRRR